MIYFNDQHKITKALSGMSKGYCNGIVCDGEVDLTRKRRLLLQVSLILVGGFLTTSVVSYLIARSSVRDQIVTSSLPLTSDNVYSEIQRDLLKPIFISSLMANDTFLRDWVIQGEENEDNIRRYLKEVMVKYNTFTSFFVSEKTRTYYHADGILKKVSEGEPRDKWYFRVREMAADYEINVDPDMANQDALTIFINHRVFDYDGNYVGAIGVGLTIRAVLDLIADYQQKYNSNIYFLDSDGQIILKNSELPEDVSNIASLTGIETVLDSIREAGTHRFQYQRNGQVAHLHTRFVPELNWFLSVEQMEGKAVSSIFDTLILNLLICVVITGIVIGITGLTIHSYQNTTQRQQAEIEKQHEELVEKNERLETALSEVKQLSGLLPICASCKKIRDDEGDWQHLESYIRARSSADFTHGICPECMNELYPEIKRPRHTGEDT